MSNPKILIVSYGGAHYKISLSIFSEMRRRGYTENVTFLAMTSAQASAERDGIPYCTLSSFVHLFDQAAVFEAGRSLIKKSDVSLDYNESIVYHGLAYIDLVGQVGDREARRLFARYGRACFMPINVMKKIIASASFNIVIATDSPRYEQASLSAAAELQIRSICVPNLFGNTEIADDLLNETGLDLYLPRYDVALVSHPKVKKRMLKRDSFRSPSSVIVTGSPIFDEVIQCFAKDYEPSRHRDTFDYETIYFYPTQDYGNSKEILRKVLIPFITQRQDSLLVVKAHPGESAGKYDFLSLYDNIIVADNWSANDIAFVSDLVVVEDSTVGIESLLMGKDVMSIDLRGRPNNNYRDFRLCPVLDGTDELMGALIQWSEFKGPREHTPFYRYKNSVGEICSFVEQQHEH